jgi:hypothetical protein
MILLRLCLAFFLSFPHLLYADEKAFRFNPILDTPRLEPQKQYRMDARLLKQGLQVGTDTGLYFGEVKGYLDVRESTLLQGRRPKFGLNLGYRFGDLELGIKGAIGLGVNYRNTIEYQGIDLFFSPYGQYYLFENQKHGVELGLGLQNIIFGYHQEKINQYGIGPAFSTAYAWHWDQRSRFFVELGFAYLFDFLAYFYRPATAEEKQARPDVAEFKVSGGWYYVFTLNIGYRLRGF